MPSSRRLHHASLRLDPRPVVVVAAGGLIGSAARTGIGLLISTTEGGFPTGVLVVNLVGSLLLGLFLAQWERATSSPRSLQFWAIGVLGSFTTFSTFSVDLVELLAADNLLGAAAYAGASLAGGLVLAVAGQRIGAVLG